MAVWSLDVVPAEYATRSKEDQNLNRADLNQRTLRGAGQRFNVERLDSGNRRLRISTKKRGVFAYIPVTPKMNEIFGDCREGREEHYQNAIV